jgi:indole-3-glycerol phosphate synthase
MNILEKILVTKSEEVAALRASLPIADLRARALDTPVPPSLINALRQPAGPHLIAEVKKASPSKGVIRADFDPVGIGLAYESGGAAALSVLTDRQYFQGDLQFLTDLRAAVRIPILRKDFIIDEAQVWEARLAGASAILLIAAALTPVRMAELHRTAMVAEVGLLAESRTPFALIGINNRDLRTFEVSLGVTEALIPVIRQAGFDDALIVSESGIFTPDHVARVAQAGAGAVLVGESLMRQTDPGQAAAQLMARPTGRVM